MNLRTLGLRKSSPLRADHPGIGQRCVLCKRAIRAGDRTGLVPPLDSEEPALDDGLICHWTCIESGLSRLRQGETAAVAHAWCINSDNFVVDPTWDEGAEYFGVPFRHNYLRRVLKARTDYGLIDNPEMDFPLVTGAHSVDEAVNQLA
jgi:hypothetical protein